ncbi:MAG: hypothetical protein FD153_1075 [Rhodospirillaceae bacterium]|nr:MAG: hypothetical protein FD153_1075 [Rhodospirillaceae bacterium]
MSLPAAHAPRLGTLAGWTDQPPSGGIDTDRGRQYAHCNQQIDGNGKVEMAAFLLHIGRSQVGDDAFGWQRQADGVQGCPYPVAGFPHGLVGQADGDESRQAGCYLYLHVDALKGYGIDVGGHDKVLYR